MQETLTKRNGVFQESLKTAPNWRARFPKLVSAWQWPTTGETARHWRGEAVKLMEQHPGPARRIESKASCSGAEVEQLLGGTEQEAESKKEE